MRLTTLHENTALHHAWYVDNTSTPLTIEQILDQLFPPQETNYGLEDNDDFESKERFLTMYASDKDPTGDILPTA